MFLWRYKTELPADCMHQSYFCGILISSNSTATGRWLHLHNSESTCCSKAYIHTYMHIYAWRVAALSWFPTSDVRQKPAKRSGRSLFTIARLAYFYFRIGIAHKSSNLITFSASQLSYRIFTGQHSRVRSQTETHLSIVERCFVARFSTRSFTYLTRLPPIAGQFKCLSRRNAGSFALARASAKEKIKQII